MQGVVIYTNTVAELVQAIFDWDIEHCYEQMSGTEHRHGDTEMGWIFANFILYANGSDTYDRESFIEDMENNIRIPLCTTLWKTLLPMVEQSQKAYQNKVEKNKRIQKAVDAGLEYLS